jgi:arsenate reductase-like glutaredoxin family protein
MDDICKPNDQDTQNDTENILNQAANEVKEIQDKVDAKLEEKCPEGLESHENILFKEISSTVIKILTDPATTQSFKGIADKLGVDISKELVELVSTTVTFATYNAIAFYDGLIKEKISESLREIGDIIQTQGSDIQVLQMKIGDIEKQKLTSKFQGMIDKEL